MPSCLLSSRLYPFLYFLRSIYIFRSKGNLPDFFAIEKHRTEELLFEYLNFGGYPRLVLVEKVTPYFRNARKEISKIVKLLFTPREVHFWRTKDKAEVDFIIDLRRKVVPLEVKYKKLKNPAIGHSLEELYYEIST